MRGGRHFPMPLPVRRTGARPPSVRPTGEPRNACAWSDGPEPRCRPQRRRAAGSADPPHRATTGSVPFVARCGGNLRRLAAAALTFDDRAGHGLDGLDQQFLLAVELFDASQRRPREMDRPRRPAQVLKAPARRRAPVDDAPPACPSRRPGGARGGERCGGNAFHLPPWRADLRGTIRDGIGTRREDFAAPRPGRRDRSPTRSHTDRACVGFGPKRSRFVPVNCLDPVARGS